MGVLVHVLDGSYAALLVFEILIVTSLVLYSLWLLSKRVRGEKSEETPTSELAPHAEVESLKNKIASLEKELSQKPSQATPSEEATQLKEKIKYLESKLLEYEIVQEEIGTITQLRNENKLLKEELSKLKPQPATAAATPLPSPTPETKTGAEAKVATPPENPELKSLLSEIDNLTRQKSTGTG